MKWTSKEMYSSFSNFTTLGSQHIYLIPNYSHSDTPAHVTVNWLSIFMDRNTNHNIPKMGVLAVGQQKRIRPVTVRLRVWCLASLSGLRIWCCHELWYRLHMWLGSDVAVVVVWAGGYSSNWTPNLGTSICHTHTHTYICSKKLKKKKKERFCCGSEGYKPD